VLICGGPSVLEREMGAAIQQHMKRSAANLVGQDTLLQLLATLQRARVLISPDSGPAHMATCVGTPVIGLYAATRLARSGPYLSLQRSVDCYAQVAQQFMHKPAEQLSWVTKIEYPGVMDLLQPDAVIQKLDALQQTQRP
jgi:heptosyltransferase I